ncbi:putative pectinesterase/pectinesterase inhibitor 12 [Hibiscus syriacus]|uniref:Pectinesterase/pectinesterase inhibitor 12 n=1 Tax=Hibiscus syriacus TaxID=106335 RepID=A0A6A2XJ90_HIBSY|nr:putative pectinesterase/pectinesterase inhibitor 12 [Hibiscus syriacus]
MLFYLLQTLNTVLSEAAKLTSLFSNGGNRNVIVEKQRGALQDCMEVHESTLSLLKKTVSRIEDEDSRKIVDARVYLSVALTNKDTCLEGLDSASGPLKPVIVKSLLSTYKHVSNSISMLPKSGKQHRNCRRLRGIDNEYDPSEVLTVAADGTGNFRSICHLKGVQDSLHDILQLPQTQELLSHKREWVEKLLKDFLRFVDVYGIFQTSFISLKEDQLVARVALRRKDDSRIAMYLKSRKKLAKEIAKLVFSMQCALDDTHQPLFKGISMAFNSKKWSWIELALCKKANKVEVEGSIEEFEQIGEANVWRMRRKGDDEEVKTVLKRMEDFERCIADIESDSDKAFRSLIKARVSLLNILTK